MSHRDSKRRFSGRVEAYAKARPSYPSAAVDFVCAKSGLKPGGAVADLGSGSGIFSALLLNRGYEVYGVEPNEEMRARAERDLPNPHFHSIAGSAEATGLPDGSVDLVTAATAFHWFDADKMSRESKRILKPPCCAALLWNNRIKESSFEIGLEELIRNFQTDYERAAGAFEREVQQGWADRLFRSFDEGAFLHTQILDLPALLARLHSASYMPAVGHPKRESMDRALETLFNEHQVGNLVTQNYTTMVYVGRL